MTQKCQIWRNRQLHWNLFMRQTLRMSILLVIPVLSFANIAFNLKVSGKKFVPALQSVICFLDKHCIQNGNPIYIKPKSSLFVLNETNTTFEVEKIIFIIFLINYIYYIFNCICLTSFTYKVIRTCSIISIYSIWIKSTADFARSRGNYFLIIFFWRCSPRICFATHAWLKARLDSSLQDVC